MGRSEAKAKSVPARNSPQGDVGEENVTESFLGRRDSERIDDEGGRDGATLEEKG